MYIEERCIAWEYRIWESIEFIVDGGDLILEVCVSSAAACFSRSYVRGPYGSPFTVSVHNSGNRAFDWKGGCSESLL